MTPNLERRIEMLEAAVPRGFPPRLIHIVPMDVCPTPSIDSIQLEGRTELREPWEDEHAFLGRVLAELSSGRIPLAFSAPAFFGATDA